MIDIGEYIRTYDGGIMRVTCEPVEVDGKITYQTDFQGYVVFEEEVKKHSRHLSDLVEVWDIVNGHEAVQVNEFPNCEKEIYMYVHIGNTFCYGTISNTEVKEILTHEQYRRNCYKLEE